MTLWPLVAGLAGPAGLALLFMVPTRTQAFVSETPPQQMVARIAEDRRVHAAMAWFRTHERELRERQMQMVAIPAPPFGERERAEWLAARFREAGLQDVTVDSVGNVVGLRPGADPDAKVVALSAHIDTVFPREAKVAPRAEGERIYAPGVTDNGAGVIGLLGIAMALQAAEIQLRAGVLFIGNVGEEGEGDLRGIRYIFNQSEWKERIGATIVLDGAGHESVVTQALGSKRFEVTVHGPGGHSWSDFGTPNPIVALSRAIARFSDEKIPNEPKTSFNLGVIAGGTSVNSIPESASVRVDIRSAATEQIDRLELALRAAVQQAVQRENEAAGQARNRAARGELAAEIKVIGSRPAAELVEGSRLLEAIRAVDRHLGIQTKVRRASTDANMPISLGREAVSIGAGGSGGGAHTLQEWYDPAGRDLGLKRVLLAVLVLAGVQE